jgi:hypothetical protein
MLSRIKLSFLISGTLHVYYMYVELKQYYKIFYAILKIIWFFLCRILQKNRYALNIQTTLTTGESIS